MTQKYTPEPWAITEHYTFPNITADEDIIIAEIWSPTETLETSKANAERIVKCVNLLAGRTDEHLAEMERWLKRETSAYMFDVITKNEKLREENERLKGILKSELLNDNM